MVHTARRVLAYTAAAAIGAVGILSPATASASLPSLPSSGVGTISHPWHTTAPELASWVNDAAVSLSVVVGTREEVSAVAKAGVGKDFPSTTTGGTFNATNTNVKSGELATFTKTYPGAGPQLSESETTNYFQDLESVITVRLPAIGLDSTRYNYQSFYKSLNTLNAQYGKKEAYYTDAMFSQYVNSHGGYFALKETTDASRLIVATIETAPDDEKPSDSTMDGLFGLVIVLGVIGLILFATGILRPVAA